MSKRIQRVTTGKCVERSTGPLACIVNIRPSCRLLSHTVVGFSIRIGQEVLNSSSDIRSRSKVYINTLVLIGYRFYSNDLLRGWYGGHSAKRADMLRRCFPGGVSGVSASKRSEVVFTL